MVARKFDKFVGNPSDIVNKAKLYNKSMTRLGALHGPKIIQFLVNYNVKMEKVLAGIRTIHQDSLGKQPAQLERQATIIASTSKPQPVYCCKSLQCIKS